MLSKEGIAMSKKVVNRQQRKENIVGYAFISPALICYLLFIAFPFFLTIILSFTEFNFLKVKSIAKLGKYIDWIGFENFVEAFKDRRFVAGVKNTFVYAIATVPASIIIGIMLAYLLNGRIFAKKLLRLAFFIPYISSIVALGAVFKFLFREDGLVNNFLMNMGWIGAPVKWTVEASVTKLPISLLVIWTSLGYVLIVYMAALQNVPRTLYEAATIDGANGVQQFLKITLPLVSPTTFYLLIIRIIAVFKIFGSVNVFTMGSSITSNTSIVQEIYATAFSSYQHGYASAQSVILLVIIIFFTAINFAGQKKWVHY
jgi:multiple sugar transport system permease protein